MRFAESVAPELRGNTYVLTHNPGMFHIWGVNAGQMSLDCDDPRYTCLPSAIRGVYLHWNFWCNVQDDVQQHSVATRVTSGLPSWSGKVRERDQRFAFYRLRLQWPNILEKC